MTPRQRRPARAVVVSLAVLVAFAAGTGAGELHANGYGQFVFRPAGTGATPAATP